MPAAAEIFRALGALCEPPEPAHARLAAALGLPPPPDAAAFTEVFVFQLVPYAAPYLSPDGMLGGEAGDRVAGFWRALQLRPPAEPDHLAALLGLYAALGERENTQPGPAGPWRQARRALLWEHLLTWVPIYTDAMGLATRAGGRAFTLAALLEQDHAATFGWLTQRAAWWAERHQAAVPSLGRIAQHWLGRAQASLHTLEQIPQHA